LTTKRFTGQYHESSLPGGEGLYFYNARWYDAQVGRFVSADTLVPDAGNPQSFNRYTYASNSPTGRIDPTGHEDCMVESCPSVPGADGFVLPSVNANPGNRRFSPSSADAINWTTAHMDLIVSKSEEYKVSPVLVSGLITAEIDLDNTWYGIALDNLTHTIYQSSGNPVSDAWISAVTDTNSGMGDRVSGYTNVHHGTYVIVEQYMRTQYGKVSPYGIDKREYLPYLLTSEDTIDFTARMACMLADLRTGRSGAYLSEKDMGAIWGAWRAGINGRTCFAGAQGCGYADLETFQIRGASLGPQSQLGRPFFTYFHQYFYSLAGDDRY